MFPVPAIIFNHICCSAAVPVPVPGPVAVNIVPALLSAAPIFVKLVFPALLILYTLPLIKLPAVTVVPLACIT